MNKEEASIEIKKNYNIGTKLILHKLLKVRYSDAPNERDEFLGRLLG